MTDKKSSIGYSQTLGSRSNQEDYIKVRVDISSKNEDRYLMVVADGMGGYAGGDLASELAAEAFTSNYYFDRYQIPNNLSYALTESNKKIADEIILKPSLRGMGTTIIAASIFDGTLSWVSVGDSVLWLFRDGNMQRLNDDHSMLPILSTELSGRALENHPQRHQLRSVLNGSKIKIINLTTTAFHLQKDDFVLIASDGVLSLGVATIEQIITFYSKHSPQQIADEITRKIASLQKPGQDNSSIAIYRHK